MSTRALFSRRQAVMLSSAAAASVAIGGRLPAARSAPSAARPLPIPTLIDAHNDEPVSLSLQNSRHQFGDGAVVASRGISSSYLGPVVRVRSGDTIPFRVENQLDEETTLHWHGLKVPSQVDGGPHNTIKPGGIWTPEITTSDAPNQRASAAKPPRAKSRRSSAPDNLPEPVAKTKLVEQLTLITLQTAHHGSTLPRLASIQRKHASWPVSTEFCNKI